MTQALTIRVMWLGDQSSVLTTLDAIDQAALRRQ